MTKLSIDCLTIEGNSIWHPNYSVPVSLKSDSFLDWLKDSRKFVYKSGRVRFSAFKDAKGYWVAQKRVNGKLRQKRLGTDYTVSRMSQELFYDVAYWLSKDGRSKDDIIGQLRYELNTVEDSISGERYNLNQEIARLKKQNDELQAQVNTLKESYSHTLSKECLGSVKDALVEALSYKANCGGRIKVKIKEVLKMLEV